MERISIHEWAMEVAYVSAKRTTCLSRGVGAVIIKDKRLIATGYNGAVCGAKHCDELGGCKRRQMGFGSGEGLEYCRAAHAEANAINQCARYGVSCEGATIYVTDRPCIFCMTHIVQSGIKRVIYDGDYNSLEALAIANDGGVILTSFKELCK